jgi:hypothetical protein
MHLGAWVLSVGLIGYAEPEIPAPPGDEVNAYVQARSKAGRDADSQVKLALWCEQLGLSTDRIRHLTLAIMANPGHAVARGLLGQISEKGTWTRPEKLIDPARAEILEQYRARRLAIRETADGHWDLALWCEQQGLRDEAVAHLTRVVRRDPGRDAAWKRLGYKRRFGRWMTDEQLASAKALSAAQKKADREWKPRLTSLRSDRNGKSAKKREAANLELAKVSDPLAVPSIWSVFAMAGPESQTMAVQLLGQIETAASSQDLALLTLYAANADTRRKALETLRQRDVRDFLAIFVELVIDPIDFKAQPVAGPGSAGVISIKGKGAKLNRIYEAPAFPAEFAPRPGEDLKYDENGLLVLTRDLGSLPIGSPAIGGAISPGRVPSSITARNIDFLAGDPGHGTLEEEMSEILKGQGFNNPPGKRSSRTGYTQTSFFAEIPIGKIALGYQLAAANARAQFADDVQAIESTNEATRVANEQVLVALKTLTGKDLGQDRAAWDEWWLRERGFMSMNQRTQAEASTIYENVPVAYGPYNDALNEIVVQSSTVQRKISCFARGTAVRTIEGPKAIETLRIGDRLLVQDADSGALQVQPIVQVYHNPPSETVRVTIAGEAIVATPIHRFWVAGRGWVRAEALKAGDRVRTLEGISTVDSVGASEVQPVFNLEVAAGESYFVGAAGTLVHDNTFVRPTPAPFDAVGAH